MPKNLHTAFFEQLRLTRIAAARAGAYPHRSRTRRSLAFQLPKRRPLAQANGTAAVPVRIDEFSEP
jgi:hypothetical protein